MAEEEKAGNVTASSGTLTLYQIQKEIKPEKHQVAQWKIVRFWICHWQAVWLSHSSMLYFPLLFCYFKLESFQTF